MSEEVKKKTKKRRRAAEIIGYIVISLIVLLLVFVILMKVTNHTIFLFDRTTMWVITPSMEPEIPERSYILIRRATAEEVELDDVIIFHSDDPILGGALNTHRVVGIIGNNEEFVTKGDNNPVEDKYTAKAENVVGIYIKTLPVMSAIGRFMFSGIGIVITMTVILGTVMFMYVPEIIKGTRRRTAELESKRQELINERVRAEVERLKAENAAKQSTPPEETPTENSETPCEPEQESETEGPETETETAEENKDE